MSDGYLYQLPPGTDLAGNLPPIDLPKTAGAPPRAPLRITVSKAAPPAQELPPIIVTPGPDPAPPAAAPAGPGTSGQPAGDPWASFPDAPAGSAAGTAPAADAWAAFPDAPPAKATTAAPPARTVPADEAAFQGVGNAVSFGLAPAISGAAEASGIPAPDMAEPVGLPEALKRAATFVGRPVVGGIKLLTDALSDHPDPDVRDAYERGRKAALVDQQGAQEQHPYAFLGGQLAGTLMAPGFGAMGGAASLGRILRGAGAGGVAGSLYGTGTGISEGEAPGDVAKDALTGGLTGAAFGGAGATAADLVGKGVGKIASVVRGARDTDAEAARRVVTSLRRDFETQGPALTPADIAAGNAAGTPRAIVDAGGEATRALMRSSANTSPEARTALNAVIDPRFEEQGTRIGGFIRRLTGGGNATDDLAAIQDAAVKANRPAYKAAYVAGDRPVWSPELERLTSAPDVMGALAGAAKRGANRAVNDGMGGFNPGMTVNPSGVVKFNKGPNGVPTYPNLQFWDYAQRELRDAATAAQRVGRNEEAGALFGLHRQLLAELDKQAPKFKAARQGAATFFKAENALEAGQNFVMSNANLVEARRALAKMTPPERELFARGFASDLADKIEKTGFSRDVLKSIFLNNRPARQKIEMALGAGRARQLEALLRVEAVVDQARKALGNSNTARQLKEMGAAGGAVAVFEGIKEHDFNPSHIIAAALTVGAARHGAKIIDEKVARRVGEMLASNDPAILQKGLQVVTSSPVYFEALRQATAAGSRVAAHDIGPVRALAGAGAVLQGLVHSTTHPDHSPDLLDQVAQ